MLGELFTNKFVIMVAIGSACVFIYRAFCRFLCPLGAIYGMFAKVAVIGIKVEPAKCVDCGKCVGCCPMDIRYVGDHECIHCGKCIDACPTNAITFRAGKYAIAGSASGRKASKQRLFLAWGAALVLLGTVIYLCNQPTPITSVAENSSSAESTVPIGYAPGMRAPDFTVSIYGSNSPFMLSEHKGKAVVINFWATWCAPCVKELPYFAELQREYGDAVRVIAIHSNLVTEDVDEYLLNLNCEVTFGLDAKNEVIPLYGGSMMLPQTIIVNADGIITYNAVGSLTLERLKELLESAM